MKRVAFLINSTIRNYRDIRRTIEQAAGKFEARLVSSEHRGHIEEAAAQAVRDDFDVLVAVGGDGTINETVNGAVSAFGRGTELHPDHVDWNGFGELRIGLFPAGSGNDFARHMELRPDAEQLMRFIDQDRYRALDIGWASFTGTGGRPKQRCFVNITDVGMGGHTVQHMERHRISWLPSNLNYMKAILNSFVTYKKTEVRWQAGDENWQGPVMSLVVANCSSFGSGLRIAPNARPDDGLFSLVTLADIGIKDYLLNMGKVKAGEKIDHPEVTYRQIRDIVIEPAEGQELPIDMDGDYVGKCPMEIRCIPGAVRLLC